jgi:tetratricopeptide (TPR) repeat protein
VADNQRIDDLRRRIQEDPASLAFAPLAEELRRAGRTQEAIRVCRTGLALHPEYLSARATLGRALLDLDQLDEALTEFKAVLTAAPDHLSAIRGVAEIEKRQAEQAASPHPADTAPAINIEQARPAATLAALERFLSAIVTDRQRRRSVLDRR